MVMSYRSIGCWKPGEISPFEFYVFIKDTVFSNLLKSSVMSISVPHDQIITTHKIAIFVKEEILIVQLKLNLLEFF